MLSLYFLNSASQIPPLQPIDYQLQLKISPFPVFGGPKCHRSKKNALERDEMRKVLTDIAYNANIQGLRDYESLYSLRLDYKLDRTGNLSLDLTTVYACGT